MLTPGGTGFYGDWGTQWNAFFDALSCCFVGSLGLMVISLLVLPLLWWRKFRQLPAGRLTAAVTLILPLLAILYLWADPFHMVSWWLD